MENTPFKAFQVPPIPRAIGTATYILYYNPLLKRITYGLPGTAYSLPIASGSTLGGVKIGTGLSIDGSGVLSVSSSYTLPVASATILGGIKIGSGLSIDPTTGIVTAAGTYSLPIATSSILGGIKVGSNLSINATTGVLDATYSYSLPIASGSVLGGIKVGTGLSIDGTGILSATASAYTLPIASSTVLGGIKVGTGLSIDPSTGILSATGGGGSQTWQETLLVTNGSILTQANTVNAQTFQFIMTGTFADGSVNGVFKVVNSLNTSALSNAISASAAGTNPSSVAISGSGSGGVTGVAGSSSSGKGMFGTSSSGTGVHGTGTSGYGVFAQTNSGTAIGASNFSASGNAGATIALMVLDRATSGTAANGIGNAIDLKIQSTDGSSYIATRLLSKWVDATLATRTSKFEIWGTKNGVSAKTLGVPAEITNYADNAAALAGGLVAGDLYRIGDFAGIVH